MRFFPIVAALVLTACADTGTGTSPRTMAPDALNPDASLGVLHNTLVDVGMRAVRQSSSRDINVLEAVALNAIIAAPQARGMEASIRASVANQLTLLRSGSSPKLNRTVLTSTQAAELVQLDSIMQDDKLSIGELNLRISQFDARLGQEDPHSPILMLSAIGRASSNYWYANPLTGSASVLHANLLDIIMFGCSLDNPCPLDLRTVYGADYVGASTALLGSAYACTISGPGWGLCITLSTGGGAIGASVATAVWQKFIGDGGAGNGGTSNSGCPSNEYAVYSRGSIACQRYAV